MGENSVQLWCCTQASVRAFAFVVLLIEKTVLHTDCRKLHWNRPTEDFAMSVPSFDRYGRCLEQC